MKNLRFVLITTFSVLLFAIYTLGISVSADFNLNSSAISNSGKVNGVSNDGYVEPNIKKEDTVHVSNADQLLEAVFSSNNKNVTPALTNVAGVSHIQKIILDKDIYLTQSIKYKLYNKSGGANFSWTQVVHAGSNAPSKPSQRLNLLVIDGQGHTLNMGSNDFALNDSSSSRYNANWTMENMKLLTSSYYGPISVNQSPVTVNYRNVDFYGAQLLWSSTIENSNANFFGRISVHCLPSINTIDSNGSVNTFACGGGGQQNMQTGNVEFHPNCQFYGETNHGHCLELYGSAQFDEGCNVELHPHGLFNVEDSQGLKSNSALGIYFNTKSGYSNPAMTLLANAKINVICDNNSVTDEDGNLVSTPSQVSSGIYATSNSVINIKGENASLSVNGYGPIYGNNPLVTFNNKMNAIVNGSEASFNINEHNPSNDYCPDKGIFYIGGDSNIDVEKDGSFSLQSDKLTNSSSNYLLYSGDNVIKLNEPKHILLDNHDSVNNSIVFMTNDDIANHYIDATNVLISASGNSPLNPNQKINFENIFANRLFLPIKGDSILTVGTRVFGDYFHLTNLVKQLKQTMYPNIGTEGLAKEFDRIEFTKIYNPIIKKLTPYASVKDNQISGQVVDDNGKPLKNAYIKIFLENDKNNSDDNKYIPSDEWSNISSVGQVTPDLIKSILNSTLFLFSMSKRDVPLSLKSDVRLGGNSFANSLVDGKSLSKNPFVAGVLDKFFDSSQTAKYIPNGFNSMATVRKLAPFVATTDGNGNFSFKMPSEVWKKLSSIPNANNMGYLDVYADYNFKNSKIAQIGLNNKADVSIDDSIEDLTYPSASKDDNKNLTDVFKGYGDRNGDSLLFVNKLKNNSSLIPVKNYEYTQPVPKALDSDNLQISYNDKNFTPLSIDDYDVTPNASNPNLKNINLKKINLNIGSSINMYIKGSLSNRDAKNNNDIVSFSPYLSDPYGNLISEGPKESIKYTTNDITFNFNNIYYGETNNLKSNKNIMPHSYDDRPDIAVSDTRRNKTNIQLFAQQDSTKFINVSNNKNYFYGRLLYSSNGNVSDLSESSVSVINSSKPQDIYWNRHNYIALKSDENFKSPGKYNTSITWTLKQGF